MGRFFVDFDWAEIVTDLNGVTLTGLTNLAASRTVTFALNRPATATGVVPSDDPRVNLTYTGDPGLAAPKVSFNDRLLYMFRRESRNGPYVCRFAGIVEQLEDAATADQPYSTFTAYDPWQYLNARPVWNGTSLIGPDGMSFNDSTGSYIAQFLMDNTIAVHGGVHVDMDSGTFETTDQIDINFQQGISVGAALQQLVATGVCDIVFEPVYDPIGRPGICVVMNVYAQAGTTRDSAVFSWDVGRSVTGISSLLDGDLMANTIQLYAGQGGDPVTPQTDTSSEARYGTWYATQFFPGQPLSGFTVAQALALNKMAEFQLSLRKQGKRTARLSPSPLTAPIPLLDYGLGDRVPVYATDRLRQAIPWTSDPTAYTRIYGIPITLSDDGVEQVRELVTSPDGF